MHLNASIRSPRHTVIRIPVKTRCVFRQPDLGFIFRLFALMIFAMLGLASQVKAQCANPANPIVAENCLAGNSDTEWDTKTLDGDQTIQGFATDISVNRGSTINFKIKTPATRYTWARRAKKWCCTRSHLVFFMRTRSILLEME